MSTTTESRTMEIAKTILEQIKYGDKWALGAWAAKNFAAVSESKEFAGGLEFQVNARYHSGWVTVKLRWVDDYTISFINKKRETVKVVEGVYCEELVEIIDWIERR